MLALFFGSCILASLYALTPPSKLQRKLLWLMMKAFFQEFCLALHQVLGRARLGTHNLIILHFKWWITWSFSIFNDEQCLMGSLTRPHNKGQTPAKAFKLIVVNYHIWILLFCLPKLSLDHKFRMSFPRLSTCPNCFSYITCSWQKQMRLSYWRFNRIDEPRYHERFCKAPLLQIRVSKGWLTYFSSQMAKLSSVINW